MLFTNTQATLIALFSVSLAVQSHGELIIIRHPPKVVGNKTVQDLTCRSEDDGSAMVWNKQSYDSFDFGNPYPKYGKCDPQSVECTPWGEFGRSGWKSDYFKNISMAPIFDYRWEDFTDYQNSQKNDNYFTTLQESGTIVFSARGSKGISLRFGEENRLTNSCFRIQFPSETERNLSINSCRDDNEVTVIKPLPHNKWITEIEWRTYIIEWKSKVKIEVFHDNESLITKQINGSLNFKRLFVESGNETRLRFHVYEYAMTNASGTKIISHEFNHSKNELDIQLLVSLCSECRLVVHIVDANGTNLTSQTIHSGKNFSRYKWPSWQVARVNFSWNVKHMNPIMIITETNGAGHEGMWAIGGALLHKSEGKVRQSTIKSIPVNQTTDVPCQKLSYNYRETSIVHSIGSITDINSTNLHRCLTENTGFCDFECIGTCNGTSICNPDGCTCAPGFRGSNCDQECSQGWYGYNCQMKCDCKNRVDDVCNKRNGTCLSGCQNHYLPSDCKKKLGPPSVRSTGESDVVLNFDLTNLNEDEKKHLHFEMKKVGEQWKKLDLNIDLKNPDWFWSNRTIASMEAWKDYKVRAVVNKTYGEEGSFNTKYWQLSEPENLTVTPKPGSQVILRWRHRPYLWERIHKYEVQPSYLDSQLNGGEKSQPLNMMTELYVTGKNVYEVQLDLPRARNYTLSVKAIDKFENSTVAEVLYVLPNEGSLQKIKGLPADSEKKSISYAFPSPENATDNDIVNVIMKRVPNCPMLKSSEKTEVVRGWTLNLRKGEFPACKLHYDLTYEFIVEPDDEELPTAYLWWFIIIPIAAAFWIVLCILYRKHKTDTSEPELPRIELIYDSKSQQPKEDNSVPSEKQKLRMFENYVRRAAENGVLQQQFMSLPKGMVRSCEYGKLPENRPKNRSDNLIAYDETRVLLVRESGDVYSDYINANYVQGFCKEKAYIATQAPLPNTIVDFWRMIWQEEVRVICMLVDLVENGKNMCERYWPEVGEKAVYGDVVVLTSQQCVLADYTYRSFTVSKRRGRHTHIVEHLQYTGWPEEGVPMYSHSVVEYLEKLLSVPPGQGPIVVHCNSGTGRTGAIILCDICRRRLTVEGTVDVFAEAKKMFSARGNMLRNYPQYALAHLVPTQCLLMLPTKVLCADITQKKMKEMKGIIPAHMKRLAETSWMDKALRPIEPLKPTREENILKNRFQKRTPVGPNLVTLTRYPTYDDNSDYISAVTVDGVKIRKQYITSQLPMPSTLTDFWRLIVEKNVELIIILQHPDPEDPTCCDIILPRGTTVVPVPGLKVETKMGSQSNDHYTMDKLQITDISLEPPATKDITAMTCKNWNPIKNARPPGPETLVEIWRASERIHRDGPTLVLCYDGLTGCGLYSALSFMLERMTVEQELDVVLAVRAVRRSRSDFVRCQWQFEYLYDAAVKFTELFKNYDNWTGAVGSSEGRE